MIIHGDPQYRFGCVCVSVCLDPTNHFPSPVFISGAPRVLGPSPPPPPLLESSPSAFSSFAFHPRRYASNPAIERLALPLLAPSSLSYLSMYAVKNLQERKEKQKENFLST